MVEASGTPESESILTFKLHRARNGGSHTMSLEGLRIGPACGQVCTRGHGLFGRTGTLSQARAGGLSNTRGRRLTQTDHADRGILWLGPGQQAPARLLHALRERGLSASVVYSAAALVVELSLGRHDRSLPAVRGVVLVEPDRLPRAGEMVDVLKDYFPDIGRWRYEAGKDGRGELAALNGRFDHAGSPVAVPQVSERTAPSDVQRAGSAAQADDPWDSADDADRLVSQDELSWLLGEAPQASPTKPTKHPRQPVSAPVSDAIKPFKPSPRGGGS